MAKHCKTPPCYREAVLLVHSADDIYDGESEVKMCLPCYLAYLNGHIRSPAETTFEILDDATPEQMIKINRHLIK